jgi:uracil-DNA glycosylase family 4
MDAGADAELDRLAAIVTNCRLCPRLVSWRGESAAHPPARFADQTYWARPVPGWGDPSARVLVVGLAPAANGGNRTGRVFTGDRSGDFLFASLYRTGFANQPGSTDRDDGLAVSDLYVAAVVRCAPPDNKPLPAERDACLRYLIRELALLTKVRVVVALGSYAWDGTLRALAAPGAPSTPKPAFGHFAEARIGRLALVGSYHPSQQNTFTGRLTDTMLDEVMLRARELAGLEPSELRED